MKIALISAFLEDDIYGKKLTDDFMKDVICNEDHFYHRIAKSLTNLNMDVTIIYMSNQKNQKNFKHKYGHKIIRFPVSKIPFLHEPIIYSRKIPKFLKENFDICHFVSGYYIMYKIPDMFDYIVSKIYKDMPIVARWSGGNSNWLFPIRKKIKKTALQRCNKIICSGTKEIRTLQQEFNINKEKIIHMYNPIDTNQFKPRKIEEINGKIDFDTNKKYLLYVGRMIQDHGIEIVLEVFKKISKDNKNLILLLIGDGPMDDEIKQYINENNLNNSVKLMGRQNHKIISYYYNISSVLFHVGPSGGMPNVIMEAIISGLQVIASKSASASSDLVNEKDGTGILIKLNDKLELEKAILKIINQGGKIKSKNAEFIRKFSIQNYGIEVKKIYQEISEKS
jgi:glycosyltransferase involved in cell wall biosynthesis